jgi:hypothetical protein
MRWRTSFSETVVPLCPLARRARRADHPSHSIGKGGAGNIGQVATPVDLSKLSLEEQDAFAKVHAHDRGHGISGGRG